MKSNMELIDLKTKNPELESIILEEYPGEIYQGQHNKKRERGKIENTGFMI